MSSIHLCFASPASAGASVAFVLIRVLASISRCVRIPRFEDDVDPFAPLILLYSTSKQRVMALVSSTDRVCIRNSEIESDGGRLLTLQQEESQYPKRTRKIERRIERKISGMTHHK
ncbi:hypothetical protein SODALDRAFT_91242 [Sodiomyces alkalinus F11]|uniref:Uncharacterized protein n=1 Tax=Sodiomyces alkalinus (strain CBS 110278 / VKM F-3762 / F11) TaxID=1314773 RepID=A0A3N2Q0C6_SODAK|nr:hypothetical protein SODALDRAFT_91242 [Sodiomyces alkalinus F11]ROT40221.1 hypothetical protein SODALDRAFT_91242 [Sodiomyces alkalinus F11]